MYPTTSVIFMLFVLFPSHCFATLTSQSTTPIIESRETPRISPQKEPPDKGPILVGMRIDGKFTGSSKDSWAMDIENQKMNVPSDKEIKVHIFGTELTEIEDILFSTHKSCNTNVLNVSSREFSRHLNHRIELEATLPGSKIAIYVCGKTKRGATIKCPDDLIITTDPPVTEYKLGYLWLEISVLIFLLLLSAIFSGLSLGLMSLTVKELEIVRNAGSEREQKFARAILPIRKKGNQLLCTLLLGNTLTNTTISLLMDDICFAFWSIFVSAMAIVILGEIAPQSFCLNKALWVGAHTTSLTQFFIFIMAPVAWPISKILDHFIGEEHEGMDKKRLMEMMKRFVDNGPAQGEEMKIAMGAMQLAVKVVKDYMKPIDEVFMLPDTAVLNANLVADIVRMGYTRIPVYKEEERQNITDVLIVKDLALLDPDDNFSVRTVCNYYKHVPSFLKGTTPLLDALRQFKKGEDGHLAMVIEQDENGWRNVGIITLEDIVEQILQEEIKDEFDNERGKKQPILFDQSQPPRTQISTQIQMVTLQFLISNEEAFRDKHIEKDVLERLLGTCTKKVDLNYLKTSNAVPADPSAHIPQIAKLYTKNKKSDKFILILEGRALVTIGQTGMKFEAGPFHRFGSELLQKISARATELVNQDAKELHKAKKDDLFFYPDFDVVVVEDCTFLEVSTPTYINALRTSLLQKEKKKKENKKDKDPNLPPSSAVATPLNPSLPVKSAQKSFPPSPRQDPSKTEEKTEKRIPLKTPEKSTNTSLSNKSSTKSVNTEKQQKSLPSSPLLPTSTPPLQETVKKSKKK